MIRLFNNYYFYAVVHMILRLPNLGKIIPLDKKAGPEFHRTGIDSFCLKLS